MSANNNIKLLFAKRALKFRLRSNKRQIKAHNFDSASTAGILFNPMDDHSFEQVKDFLSYLSERDIKVYALGFVKGKAVPEDFLMRKGFNFFSYKELSWMNTPKSDVIFEFMNQKFDILIDLNMNDHFAINYITSLSKASFKIGRQKDDIQPYDLVINIQKHNKLDYFIDQIKHYINILNK